MLTGPPIARRHKDLKFPDENAAKAALFRAAERIAARKVEFVSFLDYLRGIQIEDATTQAVIPYELWPHLVERAECWERGESEVILKARQLGLSWLVAAYTAWLLRKPHANVLMLSQGELYAKALLDKVRFINAHHPHGVPLRVDNVTELVAAGTVRALPSTKDAGRGFTGSLVVIDEAAFHPWASENYKAYRPTVADGGQLIMLSTANGPAGFFFEQYQSASRGQSDYRGVFIPWSARPGRDTEWLNRERLNWSEEEFKQEYPSSADEAFVASAGLVFPTFTEQRHVLPTPPEFGDCKYRIIGIDPGGSDPTALVAVGIYYRDGLPHLHVYDMLYRRGAVSIDAMATWMYGLGAPIDYIVGDFGKESPYVAQFTAYGFPTTGANKDKGARISLHQWALERDMLTISPHCEPLIREYYTYWHDAKSPNPNATKTPEDHHADGLDALGYVIVSVLEGMRRSMVATPPKTRYAEKRASVERVIHRGR